MSCFSLRMRCILLKFYIKPQRQQNTGGVANELYLIEILHQTTTRYGVDNR